MTIRTPRSGPLIVTAACCSPSARRRHVRLQIRAADPARGPTLPGRHGPRCATNYDAAMRAVQLTEWQHEAELVEVHDPVAGPGQVVVAVGAAGLCHSDLHMMDGALGGSSPWPLPFTLGHEVAGMDDFHVGLEGDRREPLRQKLIAWFEAAGMAASGVKAGTRRWHEEEGPVYSFFGATPDSWIGRLWPRGRAWTNGLSSATLEDNFCNRWSGGLNFLNHRYSGSEVSIEPTGDVYPCCLKTRHPLGNVAEEKLTDILDSLACHPAFQAINLGKPERMGLAHGWSVDRFLQRCETQTPQGESYRNLCIGCDAFHAEVLGPIIEELRQRRLGRSGDMTQ